MPATISVGTIAMLCVSQASGTPATRPAAPDSPAQTHSSSAVSPRTTHRVAVEAVRQEGHEPSRGRLSRAPAMVAGPYSTPVALVSNQMPTTRRIAPTATVRPNWPQVARPVWISA